jgi:hypothetical protein
MKSKIIIAFFFLGLITIYAGLGRHGSPIFIWIGISILTPYIFYIIFPYFLSKNNQINNNTEIERFKASAEKVIVSLENYQVKTNNWTDEIAISNSKYSGLDQLTGNSERNIKFEHRIVSVLNLKIMYLGKTEEYQIKLEKDPVTIKMLLEIRKETSLYIDKLDPEKKYLDLEFLNKNYP